MESASDSALTSPLPYSPRAVATELYGSGPRSKMGSTSSADTSLTITTVSKSSAKAALGTAGPYTSCPQPRAIGCSGATFDAPRDTRRRRPDSHGAPVRNMQGRDPAGASRVAVYGVGGTRPYPAIAFLTAWNASYSSFWSTGS